MRNEHLAVLALIGDEGRSDMRSLAQRMQGLPVETVRELAEEVLHHAESEELSRKSDPLLRQILKEALEENRLRKYRQTTEEYANRGIRLLSYWDRDYPEGLRHIDNPPLLLYIRGTTFPGSAPVAVVGTRRASQTGLEIAHDYGEYLARQGRTVASGLAQGIDTSAHRGALDGRGTTVGVLAGHIDHIYPRSNSGLAEEIVKSGSLVSEISRLTQIHRGRFVERNRITSGISEAVVVIECVKRSGTLHQAKFAIGQGRPTYVVDHGTFEGPATEEGFRRLTDIGAIPIKEPESLPPHL